jgi:hypothetical protein
VVSAGVNNGLQASRLIQAGVSENGPRIETTRSGRYITVSGYGNSKSERIVTFGERHSWAEDIEDVKKRALYLHEVASALALKEDL